MENSKKQIIKRAAIITGLIIFIIIIGFIIVRYEQEGEQNMPFYLSKIMIVSTADGIARNDEVIDVHQCNDIYLSFEKSENSKDDIMIKGISIENIKILSGPSKGIVKFYRPSMEGKLVYDNSEACQITDSVTYEGGAKTDLHSLTISNQGGTISFRTSAQNVGELPIDTESTSKAVSYNNDGTLLQKAGIAISDIRYNIGFDIIIELKDGKMYKGYVNESLPIEDEENGGVKAIEKVDLSNVIFKRIKIK